jgi:DNA-binding transcriptional MerR regulator
VDKSPEAFRTISEAAQELDLPQHVLRFWETRFSTIKPLKRGGGRRYYRPEDVLLLKGIRHLLYDQGFTIKGVQKILKDQGARHVAAIGNGGAVVESSAPEAVNGFADPDLPAEANASVIDGTPALSGRGRDRLTTVLRDLLEMKRLLERARE